MRMLATEIEDGLFQYTQVTRQGVWAIYTQRHRVSGVCRYALVHIRERPAWVAPNGQPVAATEVYPASRTWGRDGWTFFTLAQAQAALGDRLAGQDAEEPTHVTV